MNKYKEEAKSKFEQRGLFKSLEKLQDNFRKTGPTIKLIKKYNAIDEEATKIMLKAENDYISTFRFSTPWSTTLIKASRTVRYWNLQITKYNNQQVIDKTLKKAQQASGVIDLTTNKEEAIACRITAKADLKKVLTEANKIREEELKKRSNEAATEGDTKATLAYEVLTEHEEVRATWQKINFYLKKGYMGPLVQLCVTIPNSATSEVLTDGGDIHNRIIERNIKYFSSAESPPGTLLLFPHCNWLPQHIRIL